MYKEMEMVLKNQVFEMLEKVTPQAAQASSSLAAAPTAATPTINLAAMAAEDGIGRNDLCPCGSGKKWKNCGMKNTEEHQRLMAQKAK